MDGTTKIDICKTCGAVGHGNISCPTCRCTWNWLSYKQREQFNKCTVISLPIGTPSGSQYIPIVKSINRHNRKINNDS